jgi:hypothetical protein
MNIIDTALKSNADTITNLAGTGRTTETVKTNADNISSIKTELIYKLTATMPSTNTYSVTNSNITSYITGLGIILTVPTSNTGAATLAVNSLSTKQLVKINASGNLIDLTENDLNINKPQLFVYNGTAFVAVNLGSADQVNFKNSNFTALNVNDALVEIDSRLDEDETNIATLNHSARAQYTISDNIQTTDNTWLTIPWGVKVFDNNSFITTDNTTITINSSGLYLVSVIIAFETNTTGTRTIYAGKTTGETIFDDSRLATNISSTYCSSSGISYFNAGESFTVTAFQNSGSSLNIIKNNSIGLPKLVIARIGGST